MTGGTAGCAADPAAAPRTAGPGEGRPAAGRRLEVLGVRHHGPGSARAVRAALEQYRPQTVLIEGPPEADAIAGLAADPRMRPPVALLAHAVEDPGRAVFWPLAEFSPEWVALRWALARQVPVRFIDLPAAHGLALRTPAAGGDDPGAAEQDGDRRGGAAGGPDQVSADPLAALAEAAGYADPERWWEDAVEHRAAVSGQEALAPFAVLAEAMAALRTPGGEGVARSDLVREAHMRLRIREAVRGCDRTAVVCGAWHVPALAEPAPVTADRRLLKGLPKVRTEITWVPWTNRRLTRRSGYGAGVESPGWYHHLFTAPDRPVVRWLAKAAQVLREEDHPVSSAQVIEAVRLAEALAALRGRPLAGLGETADAVRAVLCEGSDVPLALVHDRLVVGTALGQVPPTAPAVPLARDLAREQRAVRLKPEAAERHLDLDLRDGTDARRSRLLHRLVLLGVGWGRPGRSRTGSTGTFRETWLLCWEPELAVRVAEAGVWGTTVCSAAVAKAREAAAAAAGLAEVTALAERCLLAGLPRALPTVLRELADRAALDADVGRLAQALPALVRAVRYGDVRGTDAAALRAVAESVATRVCVGLPPACTGLDATAAATVRGHLDAVHPAVVLLADEALGERWASALRGLAERDAAVPGLIRGRAARLLLDDGRLAAADAARLMSLALSRGTAPPDAAGWIEGFLSGGGMLLLHDERLLGLVDDWLSGVSGEAFTDVLPLLRRTFAAFEPGVRRSVGELVRRDPRHRGRTADAAAAGFGSGAHAGRGAAVLPAVRLLLGTEGG